MSDLADVDAACFVVFEDEHTLLLPDRRGNKRIDRLRNVILRACGLAAAAVVLAACSTPEPKPPPPPEAIAQPGQRTITVSGANAGASVTLDAGQLLIVRLSLNPAGKADWIVADPKPKLLVANAAPKFERNLRDADYGLPGEVVWTFKAQTAGSEALGFELRLPHSTQPPTQTIGFSIVVK